MRGRQTFLRNECGAQQPGHERAVPGRRGVQSASENIAETCSDFGKVAKIGTSSYTCDFFNATTLANVQTLNNGGVQSESENVAVSLSELVPENFF